MVSTHKISELSQSCNDLRFSNEIIIVRRGIVQAIPTNLVGLKTEIGVNRVYGGANSGQHSSQLCLSSHF